MRLHHFLIGLLLLLTTFVNGAHADPIPDDSNSAVTYAYFRVGDEDRESAGISLNDFKDHLYEIANKDNRYHPLSLDTLLKAQNKNTPLPEKSIHLTFEGTDKSFIRNAFPLLIEQNIPFTLFVSAGMVDNGEKTNDTSTLTWDDIREVAKSPLATIGMTGYAYTHIDSKTAEILTSDVNHARARIREELDMTPLYFSYPYGETNSAFLNVISKQGFSAAFGQQSGAVGSSSPRHYLPRFTMIDDVADMDRFRMTATTLPLPVTSITPSVTLTANPPTVSFTVTKDIPLETLKKMKCYAPGIAKLKVTPRDDRTVTIALSERYDDTKGRLNCTLPAPAIEGDDTPRWRWLGFQFTLN